MELPALGLRRSRTSLGPLLSMLLAVLLAVLAILPVQTHAEPLPVPRPVIATRGLALSTLEPRATPSSPSPWLCKCTCFGVNSTVVPLFSPKDPRNPCTTCDRHFCLSQGLEGCKGAQAERPDVDTGTGWEGDVWARCFRRDTGKDQTIVTLYLFILVGLLVIAATRSHIEQYLGTFVRSRGGYGQIGASLDRFWRRR